MENIFIYNNEGEIKSKGKYKDALKQGARTKNAQKGAYINNVEQ